MSEIHTSEHSAQKHKSTGKLIGMMVGGAVLGGVIIFTLVPKDYLNIVLAILFAGHALFFAKFFFKRGHGHNLLFLFGFLGLTGYYAPAAFKGLHYGFYVPYTDISRWAGIIICTVTTILFIDFIAQKARRRPPEIFTAPFRRIYLPIAAVVVSAALIGFMIAKHEPTPFKLTLKADANAKLDALLVKQDKTEELKQIAVLFDAMPANVDVVKPTKSEAPKFEFKQVPPGKYNLIFTVNNEYFQKEIDLTVGFANLKVSATDKDVTQLAESAITLPVPPKPTVSQSSVIKVE